MDTFIARGYIEGDIIHTPRQQQINVGQLPPILRTLLVTDGTVTKVLEAFFWEPVNVEAVSQQLHTATHAIDELSLTINEPYLQRDVILRGNRTGNIYVWAHSIIRTQILPDELTRELIDGRIGIGQLLRTKGLETYREIIDVFEGNAPATGEKCIGRTYRIYLQDIPAITVTERFPVALYSHSPQKRGTE